MNMSLLHELDPKTFAEICFVSKYRPLTNEHEEDAVLRIQSLWRGWKERLCICTICYSTHRPEKMVSMGSKIIHRNDPLSSRRRQIHSFCGHLFCADCATQFLTHSIRDGKAYGDLMCPEDGCSAHVSPLIVDELCDVQTRELYCRVGNRKTTNKLNPLGRYCPHCNEFVERSNNHTRKVECPTCDKSFCAKCSKPYHHLTSCNDISFKMWSTLKNVKRCPKCDFMIEKNGGCQHMLCSRCSYAFCWTCMRSQNDCNDSLFCKSNVMNHSIFGQSKPVIFATRGLVGAVALPFVVAAGTVAGTAYVTYHSGRLAKKTYKRRQRIKRENKISRLRSTKTSRTKVPLVSGQEAKWREEKFADEGKLILECNPEEVKRVVIPVVIDLEISLVYLKMRLQRLAEQVSTHTSTVNDVSLKVKFTFACFFLKEVKICSFILSAYSVKKYNDSMWKSGFTHQKKNLIQCLKTVICTSIGSLMIQLMKMWSTFCVDCSNDDALSPQTTFSYDSKTETYTPIVKNDATILLPEVKGLLPKFMKTLSRGTTQTKRRGVQVLLRILEDSGPNPSSYVQHIVFERFMHSHKGIDKLITEWFRNVQHSVEGDTLEWLANKSWLQKLASDTWEHFPEQYDMSPKIPRETVQNLARYCIGAIVYHFPDLVYKCEIHQSDETKNVNLFDLDDFDDIMDDGAMLIPLMLDFEYAQENPFASACMLQYVTSRISFKIDNIHGFQKGLERFKEEDVLGTLYRTLVIIYDSSLSSFLRSMCFRYMQLIFCQMGYDASTSKRTLSFHSKWSRGAVLGDGGLTCLNTQCNKMTSKTGNYCPAHSHLEEYPVENGDVQVNLQKEANNSLPCLWKQLIVKIIEACFAVMIHQTISSDKRLDDPYMLPSVCGCFHSIFKNVRSLMNLTLQDGQDETWKFSRSRIHRRRESSAVAQIEEKNARKAMLQLVHGVVDNVQLRNLHKKLKQLQSANRNLGSTQASKWIAQMYKGEEWFLIENENITYYVSFDGIIQMNRPENLTVAWRVFIHQQPWFKEDTWVQENFPMLSQETYYAPPARLQMEYPALTH